MARVGRKPTPTHLKIVRGNPGRRPLPENEPQIAPPEKPPEAPAHLGKAAREEWDRQVQTLHACGVITTADVSALAAYCQLYGRWVEAEKLLAKHRDFAAYNGDPNEGFLVSTPNGASMQHPLVGVANTAARDMMRYAAELGMTPSARSRVQKAPKAKGKEPGAEFF